MPWQTVCKCFKKENVNSNTPLGFTGLKARGPIFRSCRTALLVVWSEYLSPHPRTWPQGNLGAMGARTLAGNLKSVLLNANSSLIEVFPTLVGSYELPNFLHTGKSLNGFEGVFFRTYLLNTSMAFSCNLCYVDFSPGRFAIICANSTRQTLSFVILLKLKVFQSEQP